MPLRLRRPWSWRRDDDSQASTPVDESPMGSVADFEDLLERKANEKLKQVHGLCCAAQRSLTVIAELVHYP